MSGRGLDGLFDHEQIIRAKGGGNAGIRAHVQMPPVNRLILQRNEQAGAADIDNVGVARLVQIVQYGYGVI